MVIVNNLIKFMSKKTYNLSKGIMFLYLRK